MKRGNSILIVMLCLMVVLSNFGMVGFVDSATNMETETDTEAEKSENI